MRSESGPTSSHPSAPPARRSLGRIRLAELLRHARMTAGSDPAAVRVLDLSPEISGSSSTSSPVLAAKPARDRRDRSGRARPAREAQQRERQIARAQLARKAEQKAEQQRCELQERKEQCDSELEAELERVSRPRSEGGVSRTWKVSNLKVVPLTSHPPAQ